MVDRQADVDRRRGRREMERDRLERVEDRQMGNREIDIREIGRQMSVRHVKRDEKTDANVRLKMKTQTDE